MDNSPQLQLILLLLLVTVCRGQTMKREITYNVLGEGQKILGKIGAEYTAISSQECAARCLANEECVGYKNQHNGTGPMNCLLIHCTETDHQTFESDAEGDTYKKVPKSKPREPWNQPVSWSGPEAALYYSFDTTDGLVFMEALTPMNSLPLVPGKVNKAVTLDHTRSQWVDLGIHTEACMTRPETCTSGGAISVWLKPFDSPSPGGIISSQCFGCSGSVMFSLSSDFYSRVSLLDGSFWVFPFKPTGWTHIVLNYIGPNEGDGIKIYMDGAEVDSDTTKSGGVFTAGDGRIVVGKRNTDSSEGFTSIQIDELVFFNRFLTLEEINDLAT